MKRTILFIFSFFISIGFPQSRVNINVLIEYDGKMYKPDENEPYTGKVFDEWENWQTKEEGLYRDGHKSGLWKSWDENEQLIAKGIYRDNLKHGVWIEWHINGKKNNQVVYKNGKKNGKFIQW